TEKMKEPLPTIVVHQGTVILEDRSCGANLPAVEVANVNLTLVNDPPTMLVIDGSAQSDLLGSVGIRGTCHRTTRESALSVDARGVAIGPALERFVRMIENCPLAQARLEGRADVKAELAFKPKAAQPLSYDVRGRISQGTLQHPQIGVPLQELDATFQLSG